MSKSFNNPAYVVGLRAMAAVWFLFLIPSAVAAFSTGLLGLGIFVVVVAAGGAGFIEFRLARARVDVEGSGVVVRNPLSTVRVEVPDVAYFELRPVGPRLVECFLVKKDGTAIGAWGLREGPHARRIGPRVDEMNAAVHPRPTT